MPSTNPYTGPAMAHTPSRLLDYSLAKEQDTCVSKATETAFAIPVTTRLPGELPRHGSRNVTNAFRLVNPQFRTRQRRVAVA